MSICIGQLESTIACYFTDDLSVVRSNVIKQPVCHLPICSFCLIFLCSMTQSPSGSGQTFCFLRGLSGLLPSATCTWELKDDMEAGEKEEDQWSLVESKYLFWMQGELLGQPKRCWDNNCEVVTDHFSFDENLTFYFIIGPVFCFCNQTGLYVFHKLHA